MDDRCLGGCLPPEQNPRRFTASVLSIITNEEITSDGLQKDPQKFAGLLDQLLNGRDKDEIYRTTYNNQLMGFALNAKTVIQLREVKADLESSSAQPSATPAPTAEEPANPVVRSVQSMSWTTLVVIIILLLKLMYAIAIMVERFLTYAAAKQESREFAPRVAKALKRDEFEEALKITEQHKKSHLAMLVNAGLQEFAAHNRSEDYDKRTDVRTRAIDRAILIKTEEFKRGLAGLSIISSIAPLFGLLGMLFELIKGVQKMTAAESISKVDVASCLVNGFAVLALGLFVGIAAKWIGSYFTAKVDGFITEMENTASELLDYFIEARMNSLNSSI
jgi:biopolymer transport protein ExbB/biopolymer transport protein TolQ